MDLISIVITTYHGLEGIHECVTAAINQDYSNFEVIVVDDNGKGTNEQIKTENILKDYISQRKIKYIVHNINLNGSAARNTGIQESKGSYIAFLDDDDILHPESIRLRYDKLSQTGSDYGIVFSSFTQYLDGKKDFDCIYSIDGNVLFDYLCEKIHSPSSVLMIKKEVIETVGLWDDEFRRHQDWEFVTRVLFVYKACSIPETTVNRIVTWRNNAKTPLLFEQQRLFYLDKMKNIIGTFPEPDRKIIYFTHYVDIGKNYLKFKKFFKALFWASKSQKMFKALTEYIKAAIVFFQKR